MSGVDVSAWLAARPEVEAVFACICDLNGILRGKRLPASQIGKILDGGYRMPVSVAGVDIWGEDIEGSELVFETGDADGIYEFTGRQLAVMDWMAKPTAMAQMWMRYEDGSVFPGDPRRALASVVERYQEMGLTPVTATEMEFYVFDPAKPSPQPPLSPLSGKRLDSDGILSLDELEHFDAFLSDVYAACEEQDIPADAAAAENGAGQFEINLLHVADPLKSADDALRFRRIVKGLARKHGFAATFMAKPYGDRSGNGMHVHFSLIDKDGNNVFDNGTPEGSDLLLHAVAGLLRTMRENTLVFAPHENSFRRLQPWSHAPATVSWGYENRTSAIRIPGGSPKARRIEHRVAGADSNPYLVLASILGGALLGIQNKWQPTNPVKGDAYSLELGHLPFDWASAIDSFATGSHVTEIYSRRLQRMFVQCKRQELRHFARQVTDFEYHTYLDTL